MIDTVIFDLDGTLLYTLEDLTDSTNAALEHFGFEKRTVSEVRSFVGNGVKKLIERAIPDGVENPVFEECLGFFKSHYEKNMYNKTKPYDGVLELLKKLEDSGIKTAVVSNKFDEAVKQLCARYFPQNFCCVVGESEKVRKKPAPDSVLKVMVDLNSLAQNTIYVGDSEVDIQTAQNAKIPCVSVDWGYKDTDFLLKNGAEIVISKPSELVDFIKQDFVKNL